MNSILDVIVIFFNLLVIVYLLHKSKKLKHFIALFKTLKFDYRGEKGEKHGNDINQ